MNLKQQQSIDGRSADNLEEMPPSPSKSGSTTSLNSDGSTKKSVKFDKFTSFRNIHSHSTGQLNVNINLNLFGDVQLNDSQFFEVMYIGKIKVSHKKVPKTFIDDAIPKFIAHDKNKIKVKCIKTILIIILVKD
jgi:TBC1 domain-containing protein 4